MSDLITIEEGTLVGECEEHGVVAEEALVNNIPSPSECGICGSELSELRTVEEDTEVLPDAVTLEV